MARNKWAFRIAHTISELECINDDSYGLRTALEHLDKMLLEALEPTEREVYNWLAKIDGVVISAAVAREFGLKQNHASMILKALTDYCLLDRREELDEDGRHFVYSVHNQ